MVSRFFSMINVVFFVMITTILLVVVQLSSATEEGDPWVVIREVASDVTGDGISETVVFRAMGFEQARGGLVMEDDWQTYELIVADEKGKTTIYQHEAFGYTAMLVTSPAEGGMSDIILVFDRWDWMTVNRFTYTPATGFAAEELLYFDKHNMELLFDHRWQWQGIAPHAVTTDDAFVVIREVTADVTGDENPEKVILRSDGFYRESFGRLVMDSDEPTFQLVVVSEEDETIIFSDRASGYMDMFVTASRQNESPAIILVFDDWERTVVRRITYSRQAGFQMETLFAFNKANRDLLHDYRWQWQGQGPIT